MQVPGEVGVGEHLQERVGDQVGQRFDARAVEGDELLAHLDVVQPRDVDEEPAGHVVAGMRAAQGDEVGDGLGEDLVADGGVDPVEDLGHAVRDPPPDLVGAAEQVAERLEGERPGVLGQQVGLPLGSE
ncbi:hypothetical protein [Streptomyces marianii]